MRFAFSDRTRAVFAPPQYLAPPIAGFDISNSGVKAVRVVEGPHGLVLSDFAAERTASGAYSDGEIVDQAEVVKAIVKAAHVVHASAANVALPESKSYLFETEVKSTNTLDQRVELEQRLDELIPLPPAEVVFDFVETVRGDAGSVITGVGIARRIVESTLAAFDAADIEVRALESELFASTRALLNPHSDDTVLVVDIGRSTTKVAVTERGVPRFTATVGIGGQALTFAVQKYFGVTEHEARRVKVDRGIVPAAGNDGYLAAMFPTISAIRDEVVRRLEYWQERAGGDAKIKPVSRVILTGGNASMRGLNEYFSREFRVPVGTGDTFTNFTSRDEWIPPIERGESLTFATAIGIALRDTHLYAL